MRIIRAISWVLLALLAVSLLTEIFFGGIPLTYIMILSTSLLALMLYMDHSQASAVAKIGEAVGKINLSKLEREIVKIRQMENEYFSRKFGAEMNLSALERRLQGALRGLEGRVEGFSEEIEENRKEFERLTREYEMTYRDMARKVLELDNEMNKKYTLLGEAILKLKKGKYVK
ncbi:hypothetical protein A3K63_04535 [Candidatus Micrarchaeota archaeon RBG_16_49_10]|nr:MAG: hypothetical protein A3K63_04535 [Candidatus Micrarchaeota archaeon RBG_16_49_10]